MRAMMAVLLGIVLLTGCGSTQARFRALETGRGELEPVWEATLSVLEEEFEVAQADRANRVITTRFKVERPLGALEVIPATVARLDRFPDQVSIFRRRATARLVGRGGEYVVLLRVEKQREDTEAGTTAVFDSYDPTDTSRLRTFSGSPGGLTSVWTPAGGDDELRDRLLERIAQRLKSED